jgi:glucose/arabinose dehydrogenase
MMKIKLSVALQVKFLASLVMLLAFSLGAAEQNTSSKSQSEVFDYQISQVAEGLAFPWSLAFLPNDELLVTERSGNLRKIIQGQVSEPISGLPDDIYSKSQGGLLDVVLHPNFLQNAWIYLSYAAGTDEKNVLKVIRAKLNGLTLTDQQVLFTVTPAKDTPVHFAGRMAFLPDNSLLITSGDGFDYREQAQRLDSLLGKIIRINDDGTVPQDNPFYGQDDLPLVEVGGKGDIIESRNYIYSLGHRNAQGLIYDPVRSLVFSNEHGPAGGDEVNIITSGNNYGWPVITNGLDYSGARISPFTEYPGMQQPWLDWTPSIAPSSLAVYYGPMFANLHGDLLVTSLKFKQVYWLHVESNEVIKQSILFSEIGQRLRDIKVHSDGSIYILTDSAQGQILRISAQP